MRKHLSHFIAQVRRVVPGTPHISKRKRLLLAAVLLSASIIFISNPTPAQTPVPIIDRGVGKEMLQNIKEALKELYYDPAYHGMNLDARFKEAERQIKEAKSTWQINAIIAQVLSELNDSHTTFFPPDLVVGVNYGFKMQMIGDACYVVRIKPGGDAEKKGLKVGEVIYAIEGYEPTRESLWKIIYSYFVLQPPPSLRLTIQEPAGHLREVVVEAAISKKKTQHVEFKERSQKPPQYFDLSDDVIACKLAQFDLSEKEIDEMMKRIRTRKVLILDLRGNPGGYLVERMLGYFFERDVKVGDEKQRKKTSALMAKARGADKIFKGQVFVLVDSDSASSSEVFARVMQLEKRGTVIGDRTAGAVMGSTEAVFSIRTAADQQNVAAIYGASITVEDLIMSDGKSLEHTGITPEVLLLPKGEDLAAKRDPVLAHAASLAGVQLDPVKAGTIFPAKYDDEDETKGKQKK
jgi:C-terminal processing protease CtpA/Prc